MAVTVRIGESTATVKAMKWTSQDKQLLKQINDATADYEATAHDPWPDMSIALMAIKALGGKVIGQTKPPVAVPGRIY